MDGEPHPLRRENFAYLSEMVCERLGAQATQNPFWSVPTKNAPVTKTEPSAMGAKIRDLYQHNAEQNQYAAATMPVGFFPADCQPSDFAGVTDTRPNTAPILRAIYPNNLLKLSDCVVPDTMEDPLSLDYMRRMFYALQFMSVREWATTRQEGTVGGTRTVQGYDEGVDSQGSPTTTSVNVSANANPNFVVENDSTCGYKVQLGHVADRYTGGYVFFDHINSTAGQTRYHQECWYEGSAANKIIAQDLSPLVTDWDVKVLFFRGLVERRTRISTYSPVTDFMSYTFPVANYTKTTEQSGDMIFNVAVNKAFWRNIVLHAFPSANLTFTGSDTRYIVYPPLYGFIVKVNYPSNLPDEWTWEPTEPEPQP